MIYGLEGRKNLEQFPAPSPSLSSPLFPTPKLFFFCKFGRLIHAIPDSFGRFGKLGGTYVPETLMYALSELEEAFKSLSTYQEFQREKDRERARARNGGKGKNKDDGLTTEQRREILDLETPTRSFIVIRRYNEKELWREFKIDICIGVRDAKALQEKTAKKAQQAAGGNDAGDFRQFNGGG